MGYNILNYLLAAFLAGAQYTLAADYGVGFSFAFDYGYARSSDARIMLGIKTDALPCNPASRVSIFEMAPTSTLPKSKAGRRTSR